MAAELGMYQADISNLERARKGSGIADLRRLSRLAEYFGMTPQALIFGSGEESAAVAYDPDVEPLRFLSGRKDVSDAHIKTLERIFGRHPDTLSLRCAECGPYRTYYIDEELRGAVPEMPDFALCKMHACSFCEDRLIGAMNVTWTTLFAAIHGPLSRSLQRIIPHEVFDFSEIVRRVNPYVPMIRFESDAEKRAEYEALFRERVRTLAPIGGHLIGIIESVYVREDNRRRGVCRMMIDGLQQQLGDTGSLWLNLQPGFDEALDREFSTFPTMSAADFGQMTLNAHIAERLGFAIEEDFWTLPVRVEREDGGEAVEDHRARKIACRLSDALAAVLAGDGDLVKRGRAMQTVAALKGDADKAPEGV